MLYNHHIGNVCRHGSMPIAPRSPKETNMVPLERIDSISFIQHDSHRQLDRYGSTPMTPRSPIPDKLSCIGWPGQFTIGDKLSPMVKTIPAMSAGMGKGNPCRAQVAGAVHRCLTFACKRCVQ